MVILDGAAAYREDLLARFRDEICSWGLKREYEHPIGGPKGCDKTYLLIVEINASDEQAKEYIELIHKEMERSGCSDHPEKIRVDPQGQVS
jgi:hypothetical protein